MYEIRLCERIISIDRDTWDLIRQKVRENKWFYIIYLGEKYKYKKDQTFYDRPTRFEFDLVKPWDKEEIEIIYIN